MYVGVYLYHTDLLILCIYSSATSSHSHAITHGKHRHVHLASNSQQGYNLLNICPHNLHIRVIGDSTEDGYFKPYKKATPLDYPTNASKEG